MLRKNDKKKKSLYRIPDLSNANIVHINRSYLNYDESFLIDYKGNCSITY